MDVEKGNHCDTKEIDSFTHKGLINEIEKQRRKVEMIKDFEMEDFSY